MERNKPSFADSLRRHWQGLLTNRGRVIRRDRLELRRPVSRLGTDFLLERREMPGDLLALSAAFWLDSRDLFLPSEAAVSTGPSRLAAIAMFLPADEAGAVATSAQPFVSILPDDRSRREPASTSPEVSPPVAAGSDPRTPADDAALFSLPFGTALVRRSPVLSAAPESASPVPSPSAELGGLTRSPGAFPPDAGGAGAPAAAADRSSPLDAIPGGARPFDAALPALPRGRTAGQARSSGEFTIASAGDGSPDVVISEVYGGGGEAGAAFRHDFIELFNRGSEDVELGGWSIQYAPEDGENWEVTLLSGTLAPGEYLLVRQAGGPVGDGEPLPEPDLFGTIDLDAVSGHVAVVQDTEPLDGADPDFSQVVDLVGYGDAAFFEGAGPAPATDIGTSAQRLDDGFTDTDENADDFAVGDPTPRNRPPVAEDDEYAVDLGEDEDTFVVAAEEGVLSNDSDPDNESLTAELDFGPGHGTLELDPDGGFRYTPDAGFVGTDFFYYLAADGLGNLSDVATVTLYVGLPVVTVQPSDESAFEEGQDPAEFTVSRTGSTTAALVVGYSVSGTATFGTGSGGDYALLSASGSPLSSSGSITIPAGESEVTVEVRPVDDGLTESAETVLFTLAAASAYFVGSGGEAQAKIDDKSFGLDKSKKPEGNNHEAAHALATGAGIKVGVIEGTGDGKGIIEAKAHLGNRLKLNQDFAGSKPLANVSATNPNPEGTPIQQKNANAEHGTLVADIIGSEDARFTGVAKGAEVYAAYVNSTDSLKVAVDSLYKRHNVSLFNLSLSALETIDGDFFVDWFAVARDSLFVLTSGNQGTRPNTVAPGIAYNGITVGAVGANFKTRAPYSNWQTVQEFTESGKNPNTAKDVRGIPHVLAPGGESGKPMTNGTVSLSGTSFAAPHVTGIAALIAQRAAANNELALGGVSTEAAPKFNHLAYKAIILNSARKRLINGPKNGAALAEDNGGTSSQPSDLNYLKTVDDKPALNDAADPTKTAEWTPANWSLENIPTKAYKKLVATSPLDDEQGTGVADAERALIQYHGGEGRNQSGKQARGNVGRIGWNTDRLKLGSGGTPATHEYTLNFAVKKGDMITTTLAWDQLFQELEGNVTANPDGEVELNDAYTPPTGAPAGSDGMSDFNLRIEYKGVSVAESKAPVGLLSKGDTVEHLHFPAPEDGNAADYKIVVELKQHGAGAGKDYNYSLAWWASA